MWDNIWVRLRKLGGHWGKSQENPVSLFVVSGKALNHRTNYRRNRDFAQISKTQCTLSVCYAHSDQLLSCYREHPELTEVCRA